MVMETFLPFSQNTLKFLIKSRRRAFQYPARVRSQLTEHIILLDLQQGSVNIPGERTHDLKKGRKSTFLSWLIVNLTIWVNCKYWLLRRSDVSSITDSPKTCASHLITATRQRGDEAVVYQSSI